MLSRLEFVPTRKRRAIHASFRSTGRTCPASRADCLGFIAVPLVYYKAQQYSCFRSTRLTTTESWWETGASTTPGVGIHSAGHEAPISFSCSTATRNPSSTASAGCLLESTRLVGRPMKRFVNCTSAYVARICGSSVCCENHCLLTGPCCKVLQQC